MTFEMFSVEGERLFVTFVVHKTGSLCALVAVKEGGGPLAQFVLEGATMRELIAGALAELDAAAAAERGVLS